MRSSGQEREAPQASFAAEEMVHGHTPRSKAKTRDGSLDQGYKSLDASHSPSNGNTARSGVELHVAQFQSCCVTLFKSRYDIWMKVVWKDGEWREIYCFPCTDEAAEAQVCWYEHLHSSCEHQEWFRFWFHISWARFQGHWTLLTPVGFGCGQKLAAGPHCTQATLNNHSACFISIVVIFIMWLVLVRWICDSLNPLLTQSTVWRAWHLVSNDHMPTQQRFIFACWRLSYEAKQ